MARMYDPKFEEPVSEDENDVKKIKIEKIKFH